MYKLLQANSTFHVALVIVVVVFVSHFLCKVVPRTDSRWSVYTSMALIRNLSPELDEYRQLIKSNGNYAVQENDQNGHLYCQYPIGPPLMAIPFVLVSDAIFSQLFYVDLNEFMMHSIPFGPEKLAASAIVAITSALLYLCLLTAIDNKLIAAFSVFVFAFCTSAWSTASRALWQHGPSMLCLTAALLLILRARDKHRLIQFVSLPLAFSYVCRPTNSIPIVLLSLYVLIEYRAYFLKYCLWSLLVAVPFFFYNHTVFHSFLPSYYTYPLSIHAAFFEALIANLISPSRGIFIFSPVLIFSVLGILYKYKIGKATNLDLCLVSWMVLHWIVVSMNAVWWAGFSVGARFLTDILPILIYYLAYAAKGISELKGWAKKPVLAALSIAAVASFLIHFHAATAWAVFDWNTTPNNIDAHIERIWDWRDPQFLRGL